MVEITGIYIGSDKNLHIFSRPGTEIRVNKIGKEVLHAAEELGLGKLKRKQRENYLYSILQQKDNKIIIDILAVHNHAYIFDPVNTDANILKKLLYHFCPGLNTKNIKSYVELTGITKTKEDKIKIGFRPDGEDNAKNAAKQVGLIISDLMKGVSQNPNDQILKVTNNECRISEYADTLVDATANPTGIIDISFPHDKKLRDILYTNMFWPRYPEL